MKLGSLRIDNPFVQAPMAGITDSAFRTVARMFHSGLIFTEMISAEGLCRGNWKTMKYTEIPDGQAPVVLQLVGREAGRMAEAAKLAEGLGVAGIDINAGCPQVRIASTGSGGALLRDPAKLAGIVSAVRRAVSVPVTVKIRLGYAADESLTIARLVRDAGADMLTVHGRTVEQKFSGRSDWQAVKRVVEGLDIPVLANGDARSEAEAVELLRATGAAGVMLARATRGRPDLPGCAFSLLETGAFERMDGLTLTDTILEHARLEQEAFGELGGMKRMRKHVIWYMRAAKLDYDGREVYSLSDMAGLERLLGKPVPAKG